MVLTFSAVQQAVRRRFSDNTKDSRGHFLTEGVVRFTVIGFIGDGGRRVLFRRDRTSPDLNRASSSRYQRRIDLFFTDQALLHRLQQMGKHRTRN